MFPVDIIIMRELNSKSPVEIGDNFRNYEYLVPPSEIKRKMEWCRDLHQKKIRNGQTVKDASDRFNLQSSTLPENRL